MDLSCENDIISIAIDSILRFIVSNKSKTSIYLKLNTYIGNLCAIKKILPAIRRMRNRKNVTAKSMKI